VPVIEGIDRAPGSDELKHFGAAMASFGSTALFHLIGITPEAQRLSDVDGESLPVAHRIGEQEVRALTAGYAVATDVDVIVFSAPQLSLFEMRALAEHCDGRRFKRPLLAITSPQVKPDADRFGFTERIEAAGGTVMAGMCFYQSYAREMAEAKGWKRLATNSAKLVNILGGYGYVPMLASMDACVRAAETGELT
jgi:predicted aconitase